MVKIKSRPQNKEKIRENYNKAMFIYQTSEYNRTARKRPPKMRRLSGRFIRESNHGGFLPRGSPDTSLSKRIYCMQFQVAICAVPCCYN